VTDDEVQGIFEALFDIRGDTMDILAILRGEDDGPQAEEE
jgi:hypothetical protein